MAANGLVTVEANRILDDSINASTVDLVTAMGTATAAPTKVAGGTYTPQVPTWNAAAAASKSNSALVTFSGLPAANIVGADLKNTAGGDRRWFSPFAAPIPTASGDSISFAANTGLVFALANSV